MAATRGRGGRDDAAGGDPERRDGPGATRCVACGEPFACGVVAGSDTCWCMDLPRPPGLADAGDPRCLCERCLRERITPAAPGDPRG